MTHQNNFLYQQFVAVSGNPGGKVPVVDDVLSSHEQETYPTTTLDESSIEFKFQTDRNAYVDLRQTYIARKIKLVRGRGFDTYETTEKKKEHKENVFSLIQASMTLNLYRRSMEFLILLMWTKFHNPFFLMQKCTLTTTKSTTRTDFMLKKLTFLSFSKVHWKITRESCIVKGFTIKKIQRISSKVHF